MPATPNPKVTIPGSGVLLHVLNPDGDPVPVAGDADGNVGTTGGSGTTATTNAVGSQVDGHSASIGSTSDADSASTLIGLIKWIKARLPTALVGGRFDGNVGAWLGSTVPTIGPKTSAQSIPTVLASDYRAPVTHERIARSEHQASAPLPAAGAFTNQALFVIPEGVVGITAFITYTRGAAGGKVRMRPVFGNGTETARQTSVTSSVESGGTVVDQVALRDIDGPVVDTASAYTFEIHFEVPFGATAFALYGAEIGVPATPGTYAAAITSRYGV